MSGSKEGLCYCYKKLQSTGEQGVLEPKPSTEGTVRKEVWDGVGDFLLEAFSPPFPLQALKETDNMEWNRTRKSSLITKICFQMHVAEKPIHAQDPCFVTHLFFLFRNQTTTVSISQETCKWKVNCIYNEHWSSRWHDQLQSNGLSSEI